MAAKTKSAEKPKDAPKYKTHTKVTLYLTPELTTRLKVHGAQTGRDLSDIVADALLKTLPK